jgi:TetR/AcrR family transcriptional repressor of mexCD-oprJ operon
MSSDATRGTLLRALAATLVEDPGASYGRLAETAGISRRTLYRIAPSREALLDLLHLEALAATDVALDRAGIDTAPPREVLLELTRDFIEDGPLYSFWVAGSAGSGRELAALARYRGAMTKLFVRAQREGILRSDAPVAWLIEAYDGLLFAASSAKRRGSVAPVELHHHVLESFLFGAATDAGGSRTAAARADSESGPLVSP